MDPVAKGLIGIGILFLLLGFAWQMGWIQNLKLGRLPGDFAIERENFKFYFPLTTGILISTILTLISWLFKK
jgi:putative effector of murein hydrolase LrgA (UPF0299 family)